MNDFVIFRNVLLGNVYVSFQPYTEKRYQATADLQQTIRLLVTWAGQMNGFDSLFTFAPYFVN